MRWLLCLFGFHRGDYLGGYLHPEFKCIDCGHRWTEKLE